MGETVASYFTATSTTATSTLFGGLNVGSGRLVSDFSSGNTWLGSGNFGIGTISPLTKLDIVGSTRIQGSATSVLTGSIDPAASTAVVGVGTLFTTELVVGDRITVTGQTRTVTSITDNTNLTVDTAFSDNANDTSPDKLAAVFIAKDSSGNIREIIRDDGQVHVGNSPLTSIMSTNYTLHVTQTTGAAAIASFQQEASGNGIVSIYAVSGIAALALNTFNSTAANGNNFYGKRARGTYSSPTGVLADDNLIKLTGFGYDSIGAFSETPNVGVFMYAAENFTDTAKGTYITFETTPKTSLTRAVALTIQDDKAITVASITTEPLGCNAGTANGSIAYNGTANKLCFCESSVWKSVGATGLDTCGTW